MNLDSEYLKSLILEVIESLEKKLQGSDDNARQIIGIEKDIEYMKNSLGRIEQMVTR